MLLMRALTTAAAALCALLLHTAALAADGPQNLRIPQIGAAPTLADFAGMQPATALARELVKVADFVQRLPADGATPSQRTEVYLGYDQQTLYAIFLAFDNEPALIRATMSSRENIAGDDSVELTLDTFNDQRTAYSFQVTPLGIQWDARWTEGASNRSGFDTTWEAVWDSDGELTDQGYMVRIAVPLAGLRFPSAGEQLWRVQMGRQIPRLSEQVYWPAYSLRLEGRLNQTALLTGISGVEPGSNMMFIPYVFSRSAEALDRRAPGGPDIRSNTEGTLGLDSKFVFNDSWVLDLTLNPDFSQVESDEPQVTVNERFEVQFPERRPFFVENADFFATDSNLVFTRRIVDPEGGLRFTGRSNGWGFGSIVMNDVAPGLNRNAGDPLKDETALITVLRGFRDLAGQNRVGVLFTDRQLGEGYNRVASVDGRFKLNPNWVTNIQVIGTDTEPTAGGTSFSGAQRNIRLDRTGRTFSTHIHYVGSNHGFRSQLGFGNRYYRPDTYGTHGNAQLTFFPETSKMISWSPRIGGAVLEDSSGQRLYEEFTPSLSWNFPTSSITAGVNTYTEVLRPQDFAGLPVTTPYSYDFWSISYSNSMLSTLNLDVSYRDGTALNLVPAAGMLPEVADTSRVDISLLWRPLDRLRVNSTYLNTTLDTRAGLKVFSNEIVRSTWNYQFTKELSLRFIGQYDDTDAGPATSLATRENLNFDLLLRYVLNPWSAFFVGYNSNASNFNLVDNEEGGRELVISPDLRQDGEQFFVKFSYMWQH
jgi:hypothetical protein